MKNANTDSRSEAGFAGTKTSIRTIFAIAFLWFMFFPLSGQVRGPGNLGVPRSIPIPDGYFPYAVDWQDTVGGTATDVSFMNSGPAGSRGRIVSRNGQLVDEKTGTRIRFFGINIMFWHNFPVAKDADLIARRLAKAGINIVRIHGFDRERWQDGLLFAKDDAGHDKFDPESLKKLDYLIYRLKENGIYVWFDMKFCRVLDEKDGLPAEAKEIPFEYQKRVDIFDEIMIQDQLDFTSLFLGHKNPFTQKTYAEDECVAVIECANEDSLLTYWDESLGIRLDELPPYFKKELGVLWNKWLREKYHDDMTLAAAWFPQAQGSGSTVTFPKPWDISIPDQSWLEVRQSSRPGNGGPKDLELAVKKTDVKEPWNVKVGLPKIGLRDGEQYTLRFKAKASKKRPLSLYVFKDVLDYHAMGLDKTVELSQEWKDFELTFMAKDVNGDTAYLAFNLGAELGKLWLQDVTLKAGPPDVVLKPGESLDHGTIPILKGNEAQRPDWLDFLVDTERAWADKMLAHIRNDIGCKALLVTSQSNFAGTTAYHRDEGADLVDSHVNCVFGGWDGPEWKKDNWYTENKSRISGWTDRSLGEMGRMAMYRVAGKPFSVSEYDIVWPIDYCGETMPLFSSFAALQDWDILISCYLWTYEGEYEPNMIQDFYDQGNNPAKWSFYPQAALLFRQGLIPPAANSIRLDFAPKPWQRFESSNRAWERLAPSGPIGFFGRRLESSLPAPSIGNDRVTPSGIDPAPPLSVSDAPSGKVFLAESDKVIMCSGFLGGTTFNTDRLRITSPAFAGNFANLGLASLDGKPIDYSARLLLTIAGRAENQDLKWNADRTRIGAYWGFGPTIAQRIPLTLSLARNRAGKVWALNSKGERVKEVPTRYEGGRLVFSPMREADSLIFEIE